VAVNLPETDPGDPGTQTGAPRQGVTSWLAATGTWTRTLAILVAIVIVFWILQTGFMTSSNVENILTISAVLAIVTLGQTIVLVSGGFDLSVGGVAPLAAIMFSLLGQHGLALPLMLVLTVATGGLVGVVNALVIGRFGVNPLIATLGTLSITGGIAYVLSSGSTIAISNSDGVLGGAGPLWNLPYFVWIALGAAIAVDVVLRRTVAGRLMYSLGGNAEACRIAGIRIEGVRTTAYVISGALAALAGVCLASQVLAGVATTGTTLTLNSLAAAVLGGAALTGGVGTAPGAVLGVLIIGTISDGLTVMRVQSFYEQIISGAVLIVVVALTSGRAAGIFRHVGRLRRPAYVHEGEGGDAVGLAAVGPLPDAAAGEELSKPHRTAG
jgi:ribose transport system permease protein